MSGFWGMDTDAARAHGQLLQDASGTVDDLRTRIDGIVRGTQWTGADADAFRARWSELAATRWTGTSDQLRTLGVRARGEADQQDTVSDGDGTGAGTEQQPSILPEGPGGDTGQGYLHRDAPWLPNWLEDPVEAATSDVAAVTSDLLGRGVNGSIDLLEDGLGRFGVNTAGIGQFQRDANHLGEIMEDWATGERVPTIAELGAAGLVTIGSAGAGIYEATTGEDTAFLDDRPGGTVHDVRTDTHPARSPQTLQDLVLDNDALRIDNPGGGPLEAGRIGVQEVRGTDGGEPAYIVQVPPTEGASPVSAPEAYGGQGNSRDWGSNLRLVAGQHPAAMDDVRAAMDAAGVPPGSDVMLVGHSQGGIVANQLSADPTFNSASGEPGTYDVTHAFSVGAPVQTVVPAQESTESVTVNHGTEVGPDGISGDGIAALDLQGLQPGGTYLNAPNRHEVTLPGYPVDSTDPVAVLESNHDSVGPNGDPDGGYSGSLARHAAEDPTLSALRHDLSGEYLGDGTYVSASHVVTVGRDAP